MRRPGLWLALGGVALLAAAAGYRLGVLGKIAETAAMTAPTASIPELVLTDLEGRPQSLAQWRGKLLIVNYWATWCHPCREEMPGFSRLQDKYRNNGVQFVGISIDHADKIAEFKNTTPVSYPLLVGDIGAIENSSVELGNSRKALPFTAVFDRRGELLMTKLGRFTETELEQHLIELNSR